MSERRKAGKGERKKILLLLAIQKLNVRVHHN
jgi:hypothetical protein